MKRTLIITLEFPPVVSGISTYVHDLALALPGMENVVLAPLSHGSNEWDAAQPYRVIRRALLFPPFVYPRWLKLFFLVWRIVKKERIELIMIHHAAEVGMAVIFIKRMLHIPYLLFSHGTDLISGAGARRQRKIIDAAARHTECIVFNSRSLRRRFLRVLPQYEETSLVVYPCPEDMFASSPDEAALDALRDRYALRGKKVMLTVSRITDGKGFPHLVRMLPKILERDPNVVWIIVGDGDKRVDMMEDIQKRSLQNVVRYVGEVPRKELCLLYHLADLFVLLTHPDEGREEGLGLVFLEAAAAGLTVVAGRSGGVDEAVVDGETGIVVDIYQDEKGAIDAIAGLLQDTERARAMGKAAQERIRREFRWEREIQKLARWL